MRRDQEREEIPGAQRHSQQRRLDPGQQAGRAQGIPQAQQAEHHQQQRDQLTAEQMALHQRRHAKGHGRPLGKAGLLGGIYIIQAHQHQWQESDGRVLAHRGADVGADQPVAGQCVQRRAQQAQLAAGGNFAKAAIGNDGGGQCHRKDVHLIAGAQRQPGVVQKSRQRQKQFTVAQGISVAIAVQAVSGHAHRELPVGQLRRHGRNALQMVVQVMPKIQVVAEQRQAGRHRDARQDQRHRVLAAARRGIRVPAGKQQQQRQVQHRRQQHEDDQPGQAVDGLLGQGNAVQVKLAFAVSQGRRQVLHLCPVVHPQTSGNGAVAVVQRYGISSDSRWIALAGKRQRTRAVQCVKGGRVRRLAGEILHRHLIRAGAHRAACRRKADGLILRRGEVLAVVPDLQRRPVLVHSGDLRVVVAKIRRGQL